MCQAASHGQLNDPILVKRAAQSILLRYIEESDWRSDILPHLPTALFVVVPRLLTNRLVKVCWPVLSLSMGPGRLLSRLNLAGSGLAVCQDRESPACVL